MKNATRLIKATAVIGLCALLPGLLEASVIKQSFSYDAAGRLTDVTVADRADAGEHYRYDASGNIVEKTVNGHTATMTYDKANQLQTRTDASGTTRFVYDKAGRLIEEQRGGRTIARFEYGYLDKVTSVVRDGVETKFHYNARGMLVAKERDGEIIETLGWDGIGLVARGDTVFANEAHVSGGVPLVAVSSDGTDADYFDSDYLGTTTAAYSADGEVDVYQHSSFGQSTELADARFTGKHYDADLGAHVFPFRNYRSDAGRWTSADPAGFPDGPNQHFYAPVPTTGLDPLGLAVLEEVKNHNAPGAWQTSGMYRSRIVYNGWTDSVGGSQWDVNAPAQYEFNTTFQQSSSFSISGGGGLEFSFGVSYLEGSISSSVGYSKEEGVGASWTSGREYNRDAVEGKSLQLQIYFNKFVISLEKQEIVNGQYEWVWQGRIGSGTSLMTGHTWFEN